ncbi:MAG: transporter substrate-binding domain-containing protein [Leptospiraceae bacterium]|nr:transporter substrate-binding domain-containing protein [Leptospiraceae bacterium]
MRFNKVCFWLLAILLSSSVYSKELKVGIKHSPPFVIINSSTNTITGYSIDLLQEIVKNLGTPIEISYHVSPDIITHIEAVKNAKVDLGISATTINSEREGVVDFSQPFYTASLGIVISSKIGKKSKIPNIILSSDFLSALFSLFLYLVFFAHLFWIVERGGNLSDNYLRGIGQGFWWTIVTISTVGYGDYVPKKPLGRVIGGLTIFSGIMLFSFATASLTSVLTLESLKYKISGPNDLSGHRVGVIDETTAEEVIQKMKVTEVTVNTIEEGIQLLKENKIAAFVHDLPILQYVLKEKNDPTITLLDSSFAPTNYGITFPLKSPLRKEINFALLTVLEDNEVFLKKLSKKWFGE